ncbi:MAG: pantoate--beta-alanine ligase [Candidatus Omnitrophica bacterium]|nr:pantoate--beta-alanine ligase [Candidatus Omnitrophota bacterium]MCM8799517.1 pantoate--beta-alanine ligase [Candidatus Omnitrophota bacterium]
MRVLHSITSMQKISKEFQRQGKIIGFVPTMGYFHQGHLSLMLQARKDTDKVVVSIFVNPIQFGPKEDFKRYPRDLKRDLKMVKDIGVDIVFCPKEEEMYPEGYKTYVRVKELEDRLCGRFRPGHFQGVCTVVLKLFNIVMPHIAYFGQKDAQQAIIIKRMVKDLNIPVKIKVMPIVRESDGLAMSSRNTYLNKKEREDAVILYRGLQLAKELVKSGINDSAYIIERVKKFILPKITKIDYIEIVDYKNLLPLKKIEKEGLLALAVWIGKTRLIDNIILRNKKNI